MGGRRQTAKMGPIVTSSTEDGQALNILRAFASGRPMTDCRNGANCHVILKQNMDIAGASIIDNQKADNRPQKLDQLSVHPQSKDTGGVAAHWGGWK
jgi:hypothetical protein